MLSVLLATAGWIYYGFDFRLPGGTWGELVGWIDAVAPFGFVLGPICGLVAVIVSLVFLIGARGAPDRGRSIAGAIFGSCGTVLGVAGFLTGLRSFG